MVKQQLNKFITLIKIITWEIIQKINLMKQDVLQTVKRYFKIKEEQATIEISKEKEPHYDCYC